MPMVMRKSVDVQIADHHATFLRRGSVKVHSQRFAHKTSPTVGADYIARGKRLHLVTSAYLELHQRLVLPDIGDFRAIAHASPQLFELLA